jgi:hypothetical protein
MYKRQPDQRPYLCTLILEPVRDEDNSMNMKINYFLTAAIALLFMTHTNLTAQEPENGLSGKHPRIFRLLPHATGSAPQYHNRRLFHKRGDDDELLAPTASVYCR